MHFCNRTQIRDICLAICNFDVLLLLLFIELIETRVDLAYFSVYMPLQGSIRVCGARTSIPALLLQFLHLCLDVFLPLAIPASDFADFVVQRNWLVNFSVSLTLHFLDADCIRLKSLCTQTRVLFSFSIRLRCSVQQLTIELLQTTDVCRIGLVPCAAGPGPRPTFSACPTIRHRAAQPASRYHQSW